MGSPVTTLLGFRLRARVQRAQILAQNFPAICANTHKAWGSPDRCGVLPWTCGNSSFREKSFRLSSRSFACGASQVATTEPLFASAGGAEEGRPLFVSGPPSHCGPPRRDGGAGRGGGGWERSLGWGAEVDAFQDLLERVGQEGTRVSVVRMTCRTWMMPVMLSLSRVFAIWKKQFWRNRAGSVPAPRLAAQGWVLTAWAQFSTWPSDGLAPPLRSEKAMPNSTT